jgi:transposase
LYRVHLTNEQRPELQRRAHEPGVRPRTRDRLEMVRLSDAGWSVPQIACHLGLCQPTVRQWIKTFLTKGFDALRDQPPAGRTSRLTPALREALRQELAQGDRTWTAAQLAAWIEAQFAVRVSASHLRRFRRRWQLSWKRTGRSLNHKQKPEEVAAKKKELALLEKKGSRA